jgi:hypothetical protein
MDWTKMKMRATVLAAAIGLALGLSACETATPYQPLAKGTATSGGFTDQRLDNNHYRVTFTGNTVTSRETVETYLLYRAAQVTVESGYDWFETVDRHTARDQTTYLTPDPFYGPGYAWGYWRPSWRYYGGYGGGYGWGAWGPYGGGVQVQTVQSFQATAEIVMRHGQKPDSDPRALDARAVMTNLGPKIVMPPVK